MINKTGRIRELDILRGFASLLMILGHSFIIHPINISKVIWCNELQRFIYNFHMELFFLIAGAVYFCKNYGQFIASKTKRLVVPYAFFGIFNALIHAYGGDIVSKTVPMAEGLFKLLFKGGGYWFIFSLFTVFLIFPVIEKICKKMWQKALFTAVLLVIRETIELPTMLLIDTTAYYLPYFIFGNLFFPIINSKICQNKHLRNAVAAILSFVIYVSIDIFSRSFDINRKILDYVRALAIILFFLLAAHYFALLANKFKLAQKIEIFFKDCSRFSLQFYLFNGYLLGVLRIIVCRVFGIETPVVIVLSIFISNILFTYVACKWVIPYIPVIRTLCGLKKESVKK